MDAITCFCGEIIYLTEEDKKNFCSIECPHCGTDNDYENPDNWNEEFSPINPGWS